MQAVECGLPIITRQGRFMRGRLAGGILSTMGICDVIAADEHDYVDLAVAAASDTARRNAIRAQIERNRDVLFDDVEVGASFSRNAGARHRPVA